MNEYRIEPWDHLMTQTSPDGVGGVGGGGGVHDQYVPPELEALAREVMTLYDMQVDSMTLITAKPDKGGAIWKITTNHGPRSIKVLHRTPQRSLFSIGAQEYLVGRGARVPALIPTKEGHKYVDAGGKSWIVTEWIEPLIPASKIDLEGAQALCEGLGEFHRLSRGYVPPLGAGYSSRLYRWPRYYEKNIEKIGWFREIAQLYPEYESSRLLLQHIDSFEQQAMDTYMQFRDSPYWKMVAMGEAHWGLVHQDYGWSNGQQGPGGVWIIDLDGVSYDLPIRDLRKLIAGTMDDMGVWDLTWVRGMIEAYHRANPLDQETFDILWLDLSFPNEFYKNVKEIVFQPAAFMELDLGNILTRVLQVETSKREALLQLREDRMNYAPGDYSEAAAELPAPVPGIAMDGARWALDDLPAAAQQPAPVLSIPQSVMQEAAAASSPVSNAPATVVAAPVSVPAPPVLSIPQGRRRRIVSRKSQKRSRRRRVSGSKAVSRKKLRVLRPKWRLKRGVKRIRYGKLRKRTRRFNRPARAAKTVKFVKRSRKPAVGLIARHAVVGIAKKAGKKSQPFGLKKVTSLKKGRAV